LIEEVRNCSKENLWRWPALFLASRELVLNAFYQGNHSGLMAGQLAATYFLPTLIVPLLLITHGLAFRILLQNEKTP
jgi:hypothetical protein